MGPFKWKLKQLQSVPCSLGSSLLCLSLVSSFLFWLDCMLSPFSLVCKLHVVSSQRAFYVQAIYLLFCLEKTLMRFKQIRFLPIRLEGPKEWWEIQITISMHKFKTQHQNQNQRLINYHMIWLFHNHWSWNGDQEVSMVVSHPLCRGMTPRFKPHQLHSTFPSSP